MALHKTLATDRVLKYSVKTWTLSHPEKVTEICVLSLRRHMHDPIEDRISFKIVKIKT